MTWPPIQPQIAEMSLMQARAIRDARLNQIIFVRPSLKESAEAAARNESLGRFVHFANSVLYGEGPKWLEDFRQAVLRVAELERAAVKSKKVGGR